MTLPMKNPPRAGQRALAVATGLGLFPGRVLMRLMAMPIEQTNAALGVSLKVRFSNAP